MTLDIREYIATPPVFCEITVTEENVAELVEYLATRKVEAEATATGITWSHPMMGPSHAVFGGHLTVLRDGVVAHYDHPLSAERDYQEVQAGETGRVVVVTEPR